MAGEPNLESMLDGALSKFDIRLDAFLKEDVRTVLIDLKRILEIDEPPDPLKADLIAFEIGTVRLSGEEFEYPNLDKLMSEYTFRHWKNRAESLSNPILCNAYANAYWQYIGKFGIEKDYQIGLLAIDSGLKILELELYKTPIDARWQAQRIIDLSLEMNNPERIEKAVQAILVTEDLIAIDEKPGLWGFSFDKLLGGRPVKALSDVQEAKIITDLENRLARLKQLDSPDLMGCMAVTSRLKNYYKRQGNSEKAREVIFLYAEEILKYANNFEIPALARLRVIKELYDLFCDENMRTDAQSLEPLMKEITQTSNDQMQEIAVTKEISNKEVENYLLQFTRGTLDEALGIIAARFLSAKKIDIASQVNKLAQEYPLGFMFSRTYIDRSGRIMGEVDSLSEDFETHLILQASQALYIDHFFLSQTLQHVFNNYNVSAATLVNYFYSEPFAPAFSPDKKAILQVGLEEYFKKNYLTAAHLLIPQIEHAFRELSENLGLSVLEVDKDTKGFKYKTLGKLLRNPLLAEVWGKHGERVIFYLCVVLIEKFGWNLRNDICHGLLTPEQITEVQLDRLIHVLLLLAGIRAQE